MSHTRKQTWSSGLDSNIPGSSEKRHFIPSHEQQVQMAMDSNAGGRFTCPVCGLSFSVAMWGVFGRAGTFGEDQFFCKDCRMDIASFIPA
jgi:hypothetical protein